MPRKESNFFTKFTAKKVFSDYTEVLLEIGFYTFFYKKRFNIAKCVKKNI